MSGGPLLPKSHRLALMAMVSADPTVQELKAMASDPTAQGHKVAAPDLTV